MSSVSTIVTKNEDMKPILCANICEVDTRLCLFSFGGGPTLSTLLMGLILDLNFLAHL